MAKKARQSRRKRRIAVYTAAAVVLVLAASAALYVLSGGSEQTTAPKPIILYVNQGNGIVNGSNFGSLVSLATSHGFNTPFFHV